MAKRKTGNTQESLISTNVGVLSGQRAPEAFSRGAGIREYGSWIAAASDMNAKAVASNPLRLFARKRSGAKMLFPVREVSRKRKQYLLGDAKRLPSVNTVRKAMEVGEDFVEVMDHPIMDLIYRVNAWMCGFDLLVQTETFKQLTGNAYWYKVPGKFGVEAIWPLPPQYTYVLPDRGRYIGGYEYRPPNSGEAIRFDADEVIHFRLPNPRSQWYGMGNVERCWLATLSNRARHEMDVAFYDNYGRPDIIWIIKNTSAKQDELDAFTASMEQRLKGRRKTGKHIAVTGEIETKNLQFAPKEMANETPTIEEIAACFGIPVSMLMANDPNLASATVGYSWWREQTIAPLCRMTEDVLNQNLLPDFGIEGDAYLAFDDPVPENEKEEYDTRRTLVAGGIMTINEAREEDGDDPHPNPLADELLFNGQPIGAASSIAMEAAKNPSPVVAPPNNSAKPNDSQDATAKGADGGYLLVGKGGEEFYREMLKIHERGIESFIRSVRDESRTTADTHDCKTHANHVSQSEQRFAKGSFDDTKRKEEDEKALRDFIAAMDATGRRQAEAIVSKMTKFAGNPRVILAAVQMEAAQANWIREIANTVKPYIGEQVRAGGSVGAAILDIPEFGFDFANHEVSKWIDKATARIANDVNGTTVYRVRDLVGDGIEKGETIDELSNRVMQSGATIDPARAEMIARTESAKAYVQGQQEAWKQSGVVSHKKWLLAPDACEFCRSIAREFNANPVPLDQPFKKLGETIQGVSGGTFAVDYENIDGAPLHPGCLLPGTPVLASGTVAAFRAWYRGKAIKLSLSDGRELSVTANHMLLTPRGFVRADAICDGDHVVDCGGTERIGFGDPNHDLRESAIEDHFGSLSVANGVMRRCVPVTSEHLHGDGEFCEGNVDVVTVDGLLRHAANPAGFKGVDQLPLCADWGRKTFATLGDLDAVLVGLSLSAHGVMRSRSDLLPLLWSHRRHANVHGVASSSLLESALVQVSDERDSGNSEPIACLLDAFPGLVTTSQVVDVEEFEFCGHVYDLQTNSGLHIDNGIITSNCRCDVIPILDIQP